MLLDCKTDEKENLSYFNNQINSNSSPFCESVVNSQVSTAERSVSSQMGCKDMAGFTKYASEAISKSKLLYYQLISIIALWNAVKIIIFSFFLSFNELCMYVPFFVLYLMVLF